MSVLVLMVVLVDVHCLTSADEVIDVVLDLLR